MALFAAGGTHLWMVGRIILHTLLEDGCPASILHAKKSYWDRHYAGSTINPSIIVIAANARRDPLTRWASLLRYFAVIGHDLCLLGCVVRKVRNSPESSIVADKMAKTRRIFWKSPNDAEFTPRAKRS